MLRIGICDDQKEIIDEIERIVSDYLNDKHIIFSIIKFYSGGQLKNEMLYKKVDCLFLDIDLGEDNGVTIAQQIREDVYDKMTIIFVTGDSSYQTKVLPLHTFDYILKPFKKADIEKTLSDYLKWNKDKIMKKIVFNLKTKNGNEVIVEDDIIYIEYINRKIVVNTTNNYYEINMTLKAFYEMLSYEKFFIPHNAFIINVEKVKSFKSSLFNIVMINDKNIPISQKRLKEFKSKYNDYINRLSRWM